MRSIPNTWSSVQPYPEMGDTCSSPATVRRQSKSWGLRLSDKSLDDARISFKPISKATIQLAARVRGDDAHTTFIHFYCPMVPGGEGDWLQPSKPLANPYWGSKMLRCGNEVGLDLIAA